MSTKKMNETQEFLNSVDKSTACYWLYSSDVYARPLKPFEVVLSGVSRMRHKVEIDQEVLNWCEWFHQIVVCYFDIPVIDNPLGEHGSLFGDPEMSIEQLHEGYLPLYDKIMAGEYPIKSEELLGYLQSKSLEGDFDLSEVWNMA